MEYEKVGVPHYISEEQRLAAINKEIIDRVVKNQKKVVSIPTEWIEEYNNNIKLIEELNKEKPL